MVTKAVGERYSVKSGAAVTDFTESLAEITELPKTKVVLGAIVEI